MCPKSENAPDLFGDLAVSERLPLANSAATPSTTDSAGDTPISEMASPVFEAEGGAEPSGVGAAVEISIPVLVTRLDEDAVRTPAARPLPPPLRTGFPPKPRNDQTYFDEVTARQKVRRYTRKQENQQVKIKGRLAKQQESHRASVPRRLLSAAQVADLFGVSEQSIWRWLHEVPEFPKKLTVGKATRWLGDEIDDYIRKQAEARS